uniref:Uncharacterized protein n=1 Tax=Mucochytrium quahogii TaxID=96639 RepID=A0A7S2WIK6_9STRA|mmetsp:Transcript_6864/g.12167  ORF Transcript_6864/g.12167 Transcript_6864/m.12167 type:complete len:290 (-) Transcript_6864:2603-3472(-)|eukprot:CAMPEP_0203761806 /NCGR_PEP_ID=MMETSP0098-20131031/14821_1 /ASSEMBLY_ACC=CAM_ASM_000208 /TAXON_ID=96639 /ORGANISM=" , Strain NY0313808BC1" /LENGTH=289 /DNA_ID=CAMNT_0050655955 /DNA_START=109 /DNA_END=978 /DNA_ORIENTATION=+
MNQHRSEFNLALPNTAQRHEHPGDNNNMRPAYANKTSEINEHDHLYTPYPYEIDHYFPDNDVPGVAPQPHHQYVQYPNQYSGMYTLPINSHTPSRTLEKNRHHSKRRKLESSSGSDVSPDKRYTQNISRENFVPTLATAASPQGLGHPLSQKKPVVKRGERDKQIKWDKDEEIILVHLAYCFANQTLNKIAKACELGGIPRSKRAIGKKLKRLLNYSKWRQGDPHETRQDLVNCMKEHSYGELSIKLRERIMSAKDEMEQIESNVVAHPMYLKTTDLTCASSTITPSGK